MDRWAFVGNRASDFPWLNELGVFSIYRLPESLGKLDWGWVFCDLFLSDVGETEPTPDVIHSISAPKIEKFAWGLGSLRPYCTEPSSRIIGSCFLDNLALTAAVKALPSVLVAAMPLTTSITIFGELIWPKTAKTSKAPWKKNRICCQSAFWRNSRVFLTCRTLFLGSIAAWVALITHVVTSKYVLGNVMRA